MTKFITSRLLKYIVALLFFSFIIRLILLSDMGEKTFLQQLAHDVKYGDKIGHFLLFGLLSLFINLALGFKTFRIKKWKLQLGSVIVLSFAILEEFTQIAIPTRTFDLMDVASDIVGIVLLNWIFQKIHAKWTTRKSLSNPRLSAELKKQNG